MHAKDGKVAIDYPLSIVDATVEPVPTYEETPSGVKVGR
jgi:hypothetical protein